MPVDGGLPPCPPGMTRRRDGLCYSPDDPPEPPKGGPYRDPGPFPVPGGPPRPPGPNNCPPEKPYFLYGTCTGNPNGIECDEGEALAQFRKTCGANGIWCDMSKGQWRCDAAAAARGAGGAGGGGAGGGFNLNQFLNPNQSILDLYGKRTPEELSALNSVSSLARLLQGAGSNLYAVGMPAYTAAMDYYRAILSGDKAAATAAIAPEATQLTEFFAGARKGIEAGPLRGGARGQALAETGRQGTGAIAGLIPQARQAAASGAGAGGLAGASAGMSGQQAAAGLYGGLAEAESANRGRAASLEQANRFGGAGLLLTNKGLDIQKALGFAGLDLQRELGFASIDVQKSGQAAAAAQFQQSFGLQQSYLQLAQQQLAQQRRQAEGAKWGALLGTAIQGGTSMVSPTMALLPLLWPLLMGRP